jgi:hypothetical protein
MVKSSTKKYKNKNKNKNTKLRKTSNKSQKTRRNKKGGLLWNTSMNVGGIDLSKKSGQKEYNWKTGKWDDLVCYGIGPLKGCKTVPAK